MGYAVSTERQGIRFVDLLLAFGGSLFLALCAQIAIPLPFTPVPLTMQTFAVLLLGGLLGPRKGALSVLFYLLEVCFGFPVLAGGVAAPMALLGPRAGYLAGMVVQAYLAGLCVSQWKARPAVLFGLLATCAVQLTMGMWVLAPFVGWHNAIPMGVIPFIPGEILKSLLAATYFARRS